MITIHDWPASLKWSRLDFRRRSGVLGSMESMSGSEQIVSGREGRVGFDMVFAEALWTELTDEGVDVVGLILGKTDTPALRRLEAERGTLASEDDVPADAVPVDSVIAEAFENLRNGPTVFVGDMMRAAGQGT